MPLIHLSVPRGVAEDVDAKNYRSGLRGVVAPESSLLPCVYVPRSTLIERA